MANLLKALKAKQVYSASDLSSLLGGKSRIPILIESERLRPMGRGYYATSDLDRWDAVVLIASRYFPSAVISGPSALKIHGLWDAAITEVQADIDRGTNQKNSLIKFRRVSKSRQCGVMKMNFHGAGIKIYEPERCLADLKMSGVPNQHLSLSLINYLTRGKVNIEKVRFYDDLFKINLSKKIQSLLIKKNYLAKETRVSESDRISLKDHIVRTAILLYARKGETGLKLKDVAEEAGVSLSSLAFHFPTGRDLSKAIMLAFENNTTNTGITELFEKQISPVDFAVNYAHSVMDMVDNDEISHKVQRWAMAEKNPHVVRLMEKICNPFIAKMANKIQERVPKISREEAESRAIMFGSVVDQYSSMRWFYADILSTEVTKKTMLTNYRKTIVEDLVQMIFAPPKL